MVSQSYADEQMRLSNFISKIYFSKMSPESTQFLKAIILAVFDKKCGGLAMWVRWGKQ